MSTFFCQQCSKETEFLPVFKAVKTAGVSRSTIYYWMDRSWIHWRELPSSRRIICVESLSKPGRTDSLHSEIKPAVA
jgi:predicted DNA-binding transcriptional regulator AlpA